MFILAPIIITKGIIGLIWAILVVITVLSILFGPRPMTLSRIVWLIIVILLPFIGVILFWLLAR
ncbi:MAG: hypothetical protein K9L26_00175 [Candidatus Izimaplasma sp.]|nr:hypothetical protein [Candidatus Izimaplasma bacterium]